MAAFNGIRKSLVRSLYDVQKQRIEIGNRICAEIKARLGQQPSQSETVLEAEAKKYLREARKEFKRITDCFVLTRANVYLKVQYSDYEIITDAAMLIFVELYEQQLDHEEHMAKVIAKLVQQHGLWGAFLEGVPGCGPLMSAVILTEFDIEKAERISQFWKFAGLDVADDGRGRGRYKEHLVDQEYTTKDGETKTKKSITFNPFLKTKLVGVLAPSLIKDVEYAPCDMETYESTAEDRRKMKKDKETGEDVPHVIIREGHYRKLYSDYKRRLANHPNHEEKSKGHRNNMALRYCVKIFLQDLWLAWRELEGLAITQPYNEAVLGHEHHKNDAA